MRCFNIYINIHYLHYILLITERIGILWSILMDDNVLYINVQIDTGEIR